MIQPPPGQRKYRAFLVSIAAFSVCVLGGYVPGDYVANGYYMIAGLYFVGNVGEHITKVGALND